MTQSTDPLITYLSALMDGKAPWAAPAVIDQAEEDGLTLNGKITDKGRALVQEHFQALRRVPKIGP